LPIEPEFLVSDRAATVVVPQGGIEW